MNELLSAWQRWATRYSRPLRISRHVLIWLLVWSLSTVTVLYLVRDNPLIDTVVIVLIAFQNLVCYYLFGYFIFPRFLYRFRPLGLIGCLLLAFWLSYALNRTVFIGLQPGSLSPASYVTRVATLVQESGWLGCFTTIKVTLWNYVLGLYLATLLLLMKAVKDTTAFRNQAIRLERDKLRLDRDKLALDASHLALELDFLKMQVSPHFLFNTLNSIYARVVDADEKAADQVLRLADLMRYNLYDASAERIALEHELTYINDYLQLEQSRHAQWISVTLETDGQVAGYQIAPLLLSTFVENAFKHGVRAGKPAYILVGAQMEADTLVFTVQNSLQTQSLSPGRRSGGMGLVNVRKRLDLLYANRYTLVAGPVEDQYSVTLRMGLERLANQPA